MILKNCKIIITQNSEREILEKQDILIVKNQITNIGVHLNTKHPDEKIIDCSERVVMPGLINCHTHLAMTHLRGVSDEKELHNWLDDINKEVTQRKSKQARESAIIGIKEALRTGTTTIASADVAIKEVCDAADEQGIRLFAFDMFYDIHEKEKHHNMAHTALITHGIAPHSIYGTNQSKLYELHNIAKNNNKLMQLHIAETRKERVESKERTGFLPIEFLHHANLLGPDTLLVHAIWLTKEELDLVAKHNATVVHCPQSNMKLAGGGVMPLLEMQERNILVALGSDSAASNNSLDMFREMHIVALLHKHHYWNPEAAKAQEVLDMATVNAAKALRLNNGSIEKGKLADIIMLDATDPNLQPISKENIVSHLTFAANGFNVSEVIVDGKVLLFEKQFT